MSEGESYCCPDVPPCHGIPPTHICEVVVTQGIPSECNMSNICYPKSYEVVSNNFNLRGSRKHRKPHHAEEKI